MLQAILQNVNPEAASGLEEVIKQVCVENSNKFIYIYIYTFLCQKKSGRREFEGSRYQYVMKMQYTVSMFWLLLTFYLILLILSNSITFFCVSLYIFTDRASQMNFFPLSESSF